MMGKYLPKSLVKGADWGNKTTTGYSAGKAVYDEYKK